MESDEETATAIVALLHVVKKKKRKRSVWVKPWLGRRINLAFYEMLVQELRFEDKLEYKKLLQITPHNSDKILGFIQDDIAKTNTNMGDLIPANIKLVAANWVFCYE